MREPEAPPAESLLEKIGNWFARHPFWGLTWLTAAALAPFLAKPFNLDDPLYVWGAQQIQAHPADPFGFNVNWYGFTQPMWAAMQNPPLMSYYLAVMAGVFGWSEFSLHLACLLPAVAAVLGTYRLARNFCRWPLFAALATLFAPGFLVSSTTVMCDVAMLAFWIWALVFWTEGLKTDDFRKLSAAGILVALATLTKYNGLCLIPLLAAHGWLEKRNVGRWAIILLIPIAALGAHEWWTFQLYGHPHFLNSNQYAQAHQSFHGLAKLLKAFNALTFTGGGFALALFCLPWLWSRRTLLLILLCGAGCLTLALAGGMIDKNYYWISARYRFGVELQVLLWTAGGLSVLALAAAEAWQKREANSWLLALWVGGVFFFAAFVYWMVNARVLLPMVPAVAILVARRLEQNSSTLPPGIKFAVVASAGLSLLAAQADFRIADATRKGTEQICAKYSNTAGRFWFEGHWGFQFYLQLAGAWPLDFNQSRLQPGDVVVTQGWNSNAFTPDAKQAHLLEVVQLPVLPDISTMSPGAGAGYYSSFWGPLPFAFGHVYPEEFFIYVLKKPDEKSR
jgi:4-amino-4-deoxy-L-arabinose transferase-like glycosyltransferase